jgi:glycosyltransferase involved in cell wall biosynthesis
MRKIKVLHIITRLIRGGAEHNTLLSIEGLSKLGYDVSLAAGPSDKKEGDLELAYRRADIKLILLPTLIREISPLNDIISFLKIYIFIRKERFDIVHTHVSKAGILGRWAAKIAGVPFICHTTHGNIFAGYFNAYVTKLFILFNRITVSITNKMITLTVIGKKQWLDHRIGKPIQYIAIYSGINLDEFNPEILNAENINLKIRLGFKVNDFIIGNVGRLAPIKGQKYLIQAAPSIIEEVPEAKFLIVGDGPMREELEALTTELDLEKHIVFIGMQENIPELLSIMDLFVLPSINEGMGRALVEAMAMRLPCVATSVGGVVEVIKDGETGLLVPSQNPKALAEAICRLAKNTGLSKRFACNAQKKARLVFGAQMMVDKISSVYQSLIK